MKQLSQPQTAVSRWKEVNDLSAMNSDWRWRLVALVQRLTSVTFCSRLKTVAVLLQQLLLAHRQPIGVYYVFLRSAKNLSMFVIFSLFVSQNPRTPRYSSH